MAAGDHTKMIGDEEMHEYFTHLMRDVDLLVFGRKTYQLMVPFWPDIAKNHSMTKATNEFADTFDSINKIVFSQSLNSAEGNTRITGAEKFAILFAPLLVVFFVGQKLAQQRNGHAIREGQVGLQNIDVVLRLAGHAPVFLLAL